MSRLEDMMARSNACMEQPPHVEVQFSDGTYSFLLQAGATLVELADRVDDLAAMHDGAPIAIHVDFDISPVRRSTKAGSHSARH